MEESGEESIVCVLRPTRSSHMVSTFKNPMKPPREDSSVYEPQQAFTSWVLRSKSSLNLHLLVMAWNSPAAAWIQCIQASKM